LFRRLSYEHDNNMNDEKLNLRRFFRNRFEYYMDRNDSAASADLDGSPLTLRDLCHLLVDDSEPLPRRYYLNANLW